MKTNSLSEIRYLAAAKNPDQVRERASEQEIQIIGEYPHILMTGVAAVNFVLDYFNGEKIKRVILRDDGPRVSDRQPVNRFAVVPE